MLDSNLESQERYDIAIIGAGIYGACTCWLANHYGLKVALIERGDFASGASSSSLKIIHGGIRYLQSLDLFRTIDSIKQRKTYLSLFRHSTTTMRCVMPLYLKALNNPFIVFLGFSVYNFLSRILSSKEEPRYWQSCVTSKEANDRNPIIRYEGHSGLAVWHDAQMQHPERAVLDFVITAKKNGATTLNHTSVVSINASDGSDSLVKLRSGDEQRETSIRSKIVIDCTGGESRFANDNQSRTTKYVRAVNLVLDLPAADACFTANIQGKIGNRLLLLCPWKTHTIAGTWYFPLDHSGSSGLSSDEIKSMLADINELVAQIVTVENIINIHLGLLPLDTSYKRGNNLADSLAKRSRFYRDSANPMLFRLEGIKYTSALFDAKRTLDNILKIAGVKRKVVVSNLAQVALRSKVKSTVALANSLVQSYPFCSRPVVDRLILLYGQCSEFICQIADANTELRAPISGIDDSLLAELDYLSEQEMPASLADMLTRRLGEGAIRMPRRETIDAVASFMASKLSWTNEERIGQIQNFQHSYGFGLNLLKRRV
ncbi:MAG: FAD-dependent oxidoreductase [Pseudomonadales bacterium]